VAYSTASIPLRCTGLSKLNNDLLIVHSPTF
jgi:hypothetical protein